MKSKSKPQNVAEEKRIKEKTKENVSCRRPHSGNPQYVD